MIINKIDNRIRVFSSKNTVQKDKLNKFIRSLYMMCGLQSPSLSAVRLKVYRKGKMVSVAASYYNEFLAEFVIHAADDFEDICEELQNMHYTIKLVKWGIEYSTLNEFVPNVENLTDLARQYEIQAKAFGQVANPYWEDTEVVMNTAQAAVNYLRIS